MLITAFSLRSLQAGDDAGHGAEEIALADLHPSGAQNVVGGRQMEIEVRQGEMQEIVRALHFHLAVRTDRKDHVTVGGRVDGLGVDGLEMIEGRLNAGAQVVESSSPGSR